VELLHKLHDELKYGSLEALREGIARDTAEARRWFGLPDEGPSLESDG
jgi:riboflavin kinase/FMN adenylyltransferase